MKVRVGLKKSVFVGWWINKRVWYVVGWRGREGEKDLGKGRVWVSYMGVRGCAWAWALGGQTPILWA